MKRLLAFAFTVLILAVIFTRIDLRAFREYVVRLDKGTFFLALAMFFPLIVIPAWRWKFLIQKKAGITLWESTKLVLAASSLNVFLPSKMGDLSKAVFLKSKWGTDLKRATNVVIFERYVDTASLSTMALIGALGAASFSKTALIIAGFALLVIGVFPVIYFLNFDQKWALTALGGNKFTEKLRRFLHDAQDYLNEIKRDPEFLVTIWGVSLFLWLLHLIQFYLVFQAIHANVAWAHVFGLVPMAIFVGMIPMTVAGIGSRDAAMIVLFAPYAPAGQMAFIGLFATLRYLVPGILGLPFLNQYLVMGRAGVERA